MRTYNFQLKLYDTAVTLKQCRLLKCNEQVKLTMKHHHAKFDVCYIYDVWENPNIYVVCKPRHLTNQKYIDYLPWTHTRVTKFIFSNVCSNHTTFKLQTVDKNLDKNLESTFCSLYFWHTCDLETKSRSSNLQWKCWPSARL